MQRQKSERVPDVVKITRTRGTGKISNHTSSDSRMTIPIRGIHQF